MKKFSVLSKFKLFLIIAVAVVFVGCLMLGIFGFNNSIDYKNGYELQVSADENLGEAISIIKEKTQNYLSSNNVKAVDYSTSVKDDGTVIFKFNEDVSSSVKTEDIESSITSAFESVDMLKGLGVSAEFYESVNFVSSNVGKILLAGGIALVVVFIYTLIFTKFAGAVSTVASTALSSLLCMCLIAITRIPSSPFNACVILFAGILSSILSVGLVNRYKEYKKELGNEKSTKYEICDNTAINSVLRFAFVFFGLILVSIALLMFGTGYLKFFGLSLIFADLSACFASFTFTPKLYSAIIKD